MKKISIIYGGRSTEHDASIKSMETFNNNLDRDKFTIMDMVFIDRCGEIFLNDKKITFGILIDYIKNNNDAFYLNLLHGQEGEDGSWSGLFDICNCKGTFESVNTSSILMNKYEQSTVVKDSFNDLLIPKTILLKRGVEYNFEIELAKINSKYILVKPNTMGASHFVEKIESVKIDKIIKLVNKIFKYDKNVLIQEFIDGDEYTCGVIAYNDSILALPIIHVKSNHDFLDHYSKHKKGNAICDFNYFNEKVLIEEYSKKMFCIFNIIGMCRFDYIINANGQIYYLEGNLIPGFSDDSAFPMMLKEANITLTQFMLSLFDVYVKEPVNNKFLPYEID